MNVECGAVHSLTGFPTILLNLAIMYQTARCHIQEDDNLRNQRH
jgi:hypothetical protein